MRGQRGGSVEHVADEFDFGMLLDVIDNCAKGNARGVLPWIAIDASGDRRKRQSGASVLRREFETGAIRAGKQVWLAVLAIVIDGADRMDHVPRFQFVPAGDFRAAGRASAEGAAFGEQLRASGAVDGSVHPAAAE